jgi:hypothetical protein
MKSLIQFIFPALKAILTVVGFMAGLGWGAYHAVSEIAKAEAGAVKEEIKTIRTLDMEHLNKRFDKLEQLIKEER